MQVSLSTKSIHGVTGIGADPEGVLDKSVYGITVEKGLTRMRWQRGSGRLCGIASGAV